MIAMPRLGPAALLLVLALAACQTTAPRAPGVPRPTVVVEEAEAWRGIASPRDAAILDALGARWGQALAAARSAGFSRRIAAEGALLDPAVRLPRAAPAPGTYRCRSIRLAARKWTVSPQGFCYVGVEAGQLTVASELRGLRFGGYAWELKGGERLVFLGAAVAPGRKTAGAYGDDPARDSAGTVERIGDFRYRIALPEPAPVSGLTIVELVAAPAA
jgi:hypothetical protein